MQKEYIEAKRERFHLLRPNIYIIQGIFPENSEVEALLDKRQVPVEMTEWEPANAWERFSSQNTPGGKRVTIQVELPSKLEKYRELVVYAVKDGIKLRWFVVKARDLCEKKRLPQYYIEDLKVIPEKRRCQIRGWAVGLGPVKIEVYDSQGNALPCMLQRNVRNDVTDIYEEQKIEDKCGFYVEVNNFQTHSLCLVFQSSGNKSVYKISLRRGALLCRKAIALWKKGIQYLRTYGMIKFTHKVVRKIFSVKDRPVIYAEWIQKHLPSAKELERQRNCKFKNAPLFSIVVPLFKTSQPYLRRLVESIQAQSYGKWELCLSDGSGANSPLRSVLETYQRNDGRIKVICHKNALQISANTNSAISLATGDYLVFADHDDELTPDALFECAKIINENQSVDIIYSDEDKMSMDGNKFFQPHMKPDFNLDLLCSVNYICHLFVINSGILNKVGELRSEYDGAQDYDFILRCVETTKYIYHIPRILYHWRSHEDSTAENPESKLYAFEAGRRAVQAHFDRMGIPALVSKGERLGLYRTKYCWKEKPLISILIPNKDHAEDLERCLQSIEKRSQYRNYEYIIIENNSVEEKTFQYYKRLELSNPQVRIVYWEGEFNYSAINNFGATHAKGEYLLLLNNDTEIINEGCLEELLGYCMREDVGAVGARLYYEDNTIQHAGVVIGFGGIAGHCFVQQPRESTGYCHRIICAQDYSAVTAACMLVKKEAFDRVGGMSIDLAVAFNDIDFCMKLREAGYLIVYNPYAELYHYESKSRGLEDTPEKKARFNREVMIFDQHWPEITQKGDPYYNPNLTLESQDFSLKRL